MNYFLSIVIPLIFLASFIYAALRKVKVYDSFCEGVKGAIPMIVSVFPYIAAVTILAKILQVSGLQTRLEGWIAPLLNKVGVPEELSSLILMKPLSGGGAIAVLTEILDAYGVDSYIGRCACVSYGASDTVFYIGAVYFAGVKRKGLTKALLIALFSYFCSVVFCCFLCRFM